MTTVWTVVTALLLVALLAAWRPAPLRDLVTRCAAVAILMAVWWITEAIPIPATALFVTVRMPASCLRFRKNPASALLGVVTLMPAI